MQKETESVVGAKGSNKDPQVLPLGPEVEEKTESKKDIVAKRPGGQIIEAQRQGKKE